MEKLDLLQQSTLGLAFYNKIASFYAQKELFESGKMTFLGKANFIKESLIQEGGDDNRSLFDLDNKNYELVDISEVMATLDGGRFVKVFLREIQNSKHEYVLYFDFSKFDKAKARILLDSVEFVDR